MRVHVDLQPYRIRVYRNGQLISADEPTYNLVYLPGQRAIANIKTRPRQCQILRLRREGGRSAAEERLHDDELQLRQLHLFPRAAAARGEGGPLNPSEPLYASIPFLIEINSAPTGDYAGAPYCYGLFVDNSSQSYFNTGVDNGSVMDGKYYFGALFGDLDYYILLGDKPVDVVGQYTRLTGRSAMPPKYVFGFHQGCYGYYDRERLETVARAYREARIPIDGLHIDIDLQDNYRVFTHSEMKFPRAAEMIAELRKSGFKCSTVVTPLLTTNPLDETGRIAPIRSARL